MSYALTPGLRYRAPTHFGPAPGPRQRPGGGGWVNTDTPHVSTAWVTFRTDGARMAAHMPPGFEVHPDPRVFVEVRELRELDWLAGRGYNILHVSLSAIHIQSGTEGRLSACVFESLADAIITGRDELGIPKMYADVTAIDLHGDRLGATAAWSSFSFFAMSVSGLVDGAGGANGPGGGAYMHYRYVPKVGDPGGHDACYVVLGQVEVDRARVIHSSVGHGSVNFTPARFEELPTLAHIVNALAAFELHEVVGAGLVETRGRSDHANLRRLDWEVSE